MQIVHVRDDVESWKKAAETVKTSRALSVAVQAPQKYQSLVDQLIANLLSWEEFLGEISARTGVSLPLEDPRTAWVHVVRACDIIAAKPQLIEPDIDEIMKKVSKKLTIKEKERIIHEAKLWYLAKEGFPRKLVKFLLTIFIFLPHFLRIWLTKVIMKIYGFIANVIPGDQHDVISAISLADEEIVHVMAKRIKKAKPEIVILHEWYADEVLQRYAEL